ncbi:MAG TPA: hypothetical protein ENI76_01820 [Ignavibacteria bacterium]|nr:hypothetical protein [Ignavibacteria bacterium]
MKLKFRLTYKSLIILFIITIIGTYSFLTLTRYIEANRTFDKIYDKYINPYNGAWCWFGDPRAVHFKNKHNRIYFGWITKLGGIRVGSYDLETKETEYQNIMENFELDDHDNPSFLILPDNRIMLFFSKHVGEYLYSTISKKPEDIGSWEDIKTIYHNPNENGGITYPSPVQLSEEGNNIYLFWRGIKFQPYFSKSINGKDWEKEKQLIESKYRSPYLKLVSNNKDAIHFAFTDGHPNDLLPNSIYYFKYEAGKFYSADSKIISTIENLPIKPSNSIKVYNSKSIQNRSWIWDIALENDSIPVLVYSVFKDSLDHRYYYSKYVHNSWITTEITKAGKWFPQEFSEREYFYSGGIVLNHNNPSEVFLSKELNGFFEIWKYWTSDNGKTWKKQKITNNSKINNVRPYLVPVDNKTDFLLWLQGDYLHYDNFDTNIKYLVLKKK